MDVSVGFLGLFWAIEAARVSLSPEVLYLFYMHLSCFW
jgi:hypothetical protein